MNDPLEYSVAEPVIRSNRAADLRYRTWYSQKVRCMAIVMVS